MMDDRDVRAAAREDATDAELELAALVGRAVLGDPTHPAWDDPRFIEWLAGEARDGARRSWRMSAAGRRAHGEAMMARAQARRLRVAQGGRAPIVETVEGDGARRVPVVELGIAAGVGRELWDEPPDAWVELPNDTPTGEYLALRIIGDSMAPLMHTDDTVLVRRGGDVQR